MLGKIKKTILIFDPRKLGTAVGNQLDFDAGMDNFRNLCQLEDRILYSASPIGVSAEMPIDQGAIDAITYHDLAEAAPIATNDQVASADFLPPPPFGSDHELFVIDSRVENLSELLEEQLLDESINATLIDIGSESDGIVQLTEILESYTELAAIHLFSHGESGVIQLGNTQLSATTFESYSAQIETWGQALHDDGDILIYGCDVAAGTEGQWLINEIADITTADVSASTDLTGHADLGGDWILETTIGAKPEAPSWLTEVSETWSSTLGVVAGADFFTTNENQVLSVDSDSGVLANDILDPTSGTITQSPELNFDASQDVSPNQTWENTSGISGFDFALSPTVANNTAIDAPPEITSAYLFDGAGSATLGSTFSNLSLDPTTEAVSFETWFRPASGTVSDSYLFEVGSQNSGINLSIFNDNVDGTIKLALTVNGTQSISVVSDISSEVLSGSFIQAITTFDPSTGTAELYVNGISVGTATDSTITDWSDSTETTSLAKSNGTAKVVSGQAIFSGFRGEIANFSFYRAILSSSEIQQDYTASNSFLSVVSYDSVSQQNATISMQPDGSFVYDPGDNFDYLTGTESANDSFAYTVTDNVGNSETATVQIQIFGQNDNPSDIEFSNNTIDENTDTTGGYTVTNLLTADLDTNDFFTYSIVGGADAGKFTISGSELQLTDGIIDFESQESYSVQVETQDSNNASFQKSFLLNVNNLDDTAPVLTSPPNVEVDENISANAVVYTAFADDSADVSNGITFAISGTDAASFSIDQNTGQVSILASPDAEIKDTYQIQIVATDDAGNASTPLSVLIGINDLDETAPIITSPTNVAINENIPANQVIYTATADDSADISNGVTFAITGTDADSFSIDSNTGDLSMLASPDAEIKDTYQINIIATDNAGNSSNPHSVLININNLDDTPPTITSPTNINVDENIPTNQTIYIATADDSADTSNGVTFELSGTDAASFSIDQDTGEVTILASPDAETKATYQIQITATDAAGNSSAPKSVSISINNLDETPPLITSPNNVVLDENIPADQIIYTATADDSADISNGFTFAISGTDADSFSIDQNTGEVTILASPDAETKGTYQIQITATDAAGNSSNPHTVSIAINNLDETPPIITSPSSVAFDENIPANQIVYTVTADDSADVSNGFTFAISGPDADSFSLDQNTGEVSILASPDAETKANYQIQITATDAAGNASNPHSVLISINNLDDTAPVITSPTDVSVDENIPANQIIYNATADDSADVSNGVNFAITGIDADSFSIDQDTGEVSILSSPDAEIRNFYEFNLIATDNAGNSSSPHSVQVSINNLDDTAPTITSANNIAVDENIATNQVVYTVTADDSADVSNAVTFAITGTDAASFSIDPDTGDLLFIDSPDADTKDSYQIQIIATDEAGNSSTPHSLLISINNLDDTAPIITSPTVVSADENIAVNQIIYTATADDSADISNGVTFALSGADAASFSIDSNTGEVSILNSPDAETKQTYQIKITATDDAGNASTPHSVLISINNLDDTPPTITSPTNIAVNENIPASQVVYTATADDSADVSNGITFAITGTDAASFSIDGNTGEVSFLNSPDAETKQTYQIKIIATDDAGNASTPHSVLISINNLDDTAPTITSPSDVAVDENIPASQVVYTATASDSADVSNGVTFAISGTDADSFSINQNTGEVTILDSPDAEVKDNYQIQITATDAAGNSSAPHSVLISISNLDDTAPTITSPTNFAVDENIPANQIVYVATADDSADISDGVTFAISGTDADNFSINQNTGEVSILVSPDVETKATYAFTVTATDSAGNASDPLDITLNVNDINESPTAITPSEVNLLSGTNTTDGIKVADLEATDPDILESFTYSIVDDLDSGSFILTNNVLFFDAGIVNGLVKSTYSIRIQVADSGGNVFESTFTLNVTQTNQPPTAITPGTISINENIDTTGGYDLGLISATDPDVFDTFTYLILPGMDASHFSLGGSQLNQLIFDAGTLDYETKPNYSVTIKVTDSQGNELDSTLSIHVVDLNETPSSITLSNSRIPENSDTSNGYAIGDLQTTDEDFGDTHSYTITGGADQNNFSLGGNNGTTLILSDLLVDFETQSTYEVEITATDSGGNQIQGILTINVDDQNDTPSGINPTNFSILENQGLDAGVVLGDLITLDQDTNDSFTYSIIGGVDKNVFQIGGTLNDQLIITESNIDYETQDSYSVIIRTTDASNAHHDSLINISVVDQNEAPFDLTPTEFSILENTPVSTGIAIGSLNASDPDFNESFSFNIVAGFDSENFSITNSTLYFTHDAVDYEQKTTFQTSILVQDSGGNQLVELITVEIIDQNEAPSDLLNTNFQIADNADTTTGRSLGTLNAVDPDANETFSYEILGGTNSSLFSIGGTNNDELILTAKTLDSASQPLLSVDVKVTDSGGNSHTESIAVSIISFNSAFLPPTIEDNAPAIIDDANLENTDEAPSSNDSELIIEETILETITENTEITAIASAPVQMDVGMIQTMNAITRFDRGPQFTELVQEDYIFEKQITLTSAIEEASEKEIKTRFSSAEIAASHFESIFSGSALTSLNALQLEVSQDSLFSKSILGTTTIASASLTAGYVIWLLRSGVLFSSMVTSLPAWRTFDPLPVLGYLNEIDNEQIEDDSLETLVINSNRASKAVNHEI